MPRSQGSIRLSSSAVRESRACFGKPLPRNVHLAVPRRTPRDCVSRSPAVPVYYILGNVIDQSLADIYVHMHNADEKAHKNNLPIG